MNIARLLIPLLFAGCALPFGPAIGRDYALVPVRWGSVTALLCDRLWGLEEGDAAPTLLCRFNGPTPFFGVVPSPNGAPRAFRADGTPSATPPRIDPVPVAALRDCPPPARRTYPLTVREAVILSKWEECIDPKL